MDNQISSRLLRITTGSELQLRIPAGSAWNTIGLKLRVFAFYLIFLQMIFFAKRVFLVPKLSNFLKHPGTSENVPELPKNTRGHPKNTRNFPKTPETSQKHPELPRTSRELSETPVELPNTRGTSQKHPGRWWVVGG
jgi:hypothetical protein